MRVTVSLTLLFAVAVLANFHSKCTPVADRGPCRARIPMWAYNVTKGRCQRFTYGGCDGNQNKYHTKTACEQICQRSKDSHDPGRPQELREGPMEILSPPQVPSLMWSVLTNPACLLPPVRGMCSGLIQRFYYDVSNRMCQGFAYGGCGGNANNFASLGQCYQACSPRQNITPRS
ncbi:kunitz-type serine protease inhibitor 6-like [Amblyomma americanum]